MYLLAHLALGAVAADLVRRWRPGARLDARWVLLGAILPDLVDKPLGFALGLSGRIWAHTALVALAVTFVGAAFSRRGSGAVLALALGMWTHLLLDRMWMLPMTFLYPAYGFAFPPEAISLGDYLHTLLADPVVWAGEIVGAIVLIAIAWRNGVRDWLSVRRFLLTGAVAPRQIS